MELCDFREETGEGEIGATIRCSRKFETKEVEFRHPDYKELSVRLYLCQHHFDVVFGEMFSIEDKAFRKKLNAIKKYRDDFKFTRENVRDGIGEEHFDWTLWKLQNYRHVDKAKADLKNIRRNDCRLEYCNNKVDFKRNYSIRVFRKNVYDYISLNFCCHKHWDSIKLRIGILKTQEKKPPLTLDNYSQ